MGGAAQGGREGECGRPTTPSSTLLSPRYAPTAASFTSDPPALAVAAGSSVLVVTGWPARPVAAVAGAHGGRVAGVAWGHRRNATAPPPLYSVAADKTVRAWDVAAQRCVRVARGAPADAAALAVAGGGGAPPVVLVAGRAAGLLVWRPEATPSRLAPCAWAPPGGATAVAAAGRVAAVGAGAGAVFLVAVDAAGDDCVRVLRKVWDHAGCVHDVALREVGSGTRLLIASGGADGRLHAAQADLDDDGDDVVAFASLDAPPAPAGASSGGAPGARAWRGVEWAPTLPPSPHTAWLLTSGNGGDVLAWKLSFTGGEPRAAPPARLPAVGARPAFALAAAPASADGAPAMLAVTCLDRTTRVWALPDAAEGASDWRRAVPLPPLPGLGGAATGLAATPDGSFVAVCVAGADGCVRSWAPARGRGVASRAALAWRGVPPRAACIAVRPTPDGAHIIAVGGGDGGGLAVVAAGAARGAPLTAAGPALASLAWLPAPPSADLLALTQDGRLQRWPARSVDAAAAAAATAGGALPRATAPPPADAAAELDPDAAGDTLTSLAVADLGAAGVALAVGTAGGGVRAYRRAATPAAPWARDPPPPASRGHAAAVGALAWRVEVEPGDGGLPWLASACAGGAVAVAAGARAPATLPPGPPASALAWVPNGSTLAVGRADGTIDVVAVAPAASALATARTLRRHGARVRALAWLPPPHGLGGGRPALLSAGDDHSVRCWDAEGGGEGEGVAAAAAAPAPAPAPRPRQAPGAWLGTESLLPVDRDGGAATDLASLACALAAARRGRERPSPRCANPWVDTGAAIASLHAAADAEAATAAALPRGDARAARRAAALRLFAGDPGGAAAELATIPGPPDADAVALAAAAGRGAYAAAATARAASLAAAGDAHLAALYHLAAGDARAAVACLARRGLATDAGALARARLPPGAAATAVAAASIAPRLAAAGDAAGAAAAWLAAGDAGEAAAAGGGADAGALAAALAE